MKSKTLLAPVLMAFGFILGVPAVGDDASSDSGATTVATIDAIVVDVPANEMTVCVTLDAIEAAVPCAISADASTLAVVTLEPGVNFVVVPVFDMESLTVCAFPENPGVN